eukprot:Gregarina_sp_Poly_1__6435@NODE_343_length_9409_cov_658_993470_g287_i0_p8_GENE_NODE_343_length_9409_cov_658_993470_g287_i0NODE_343_length_9409_cov_658_993470_g287_i0_p8_ORF_typecomplete_len144_score16_94Histone/PF00125_24/3_5e20TFIID_NTD2/PF04494_15/0_27TFIID_NTD2/PF04494_15/1_3e03TFIID_20kDa/PF03847_13/2_7e03TFIID_20kDa/PF03847_13/0_46RhlB/PF12300_8/0_34_NODE_343_length_9409_cov_658_993470_g287_i014661897
MNPDLNRGGGRSGKSLSSPSGSPAGSSTNTGSTSPAKKKKKSTTTTKSDLYNSYIFKLLRQVKPDVRITSRAMSIMNSFVLDAFERIAGEAGKLCTITKKETLTSNEVRTAVQLVLQGDLAKHAILEGVQAVQTYMGTGTKRN